MKHSPHAAMRSRFRRRSLAVTVAIGATLLVVPPTADAAPSSSPASVTSSSSKSALIGLRSGDRGAAVKKLQKMLQKAGLVVSGGADGIYGAGTTAAVKMFQSWNGLQRTGTVTQATYQWLKIAGSNAAASSASKKASAAKTTSTAKSGISSGSSSSWIGLKQGKRGTAVKQLQKALIKAGVPVMGGADGIFGPATRSAVSSFQGWNGLRRTGAVNKSTERSIRSAASSKSASSSSKTSSTKSKSTSTSSKYVGLKQGSSGSAVKELQRALMGSGLTLFGGADGVFGPATRSALKLYQKVNGMKQTGTLNAKAAGYLGLGTSKSGITTTTGHAKFGEVGSRVVALQKALMAAGISVPGGADGVFGGSTAGAVMEFQRQKGLAVTGKVDSVAASRLNLKAASAPSAPSTATVKMKVFPVQGLCWYADTWLAPRGDGRTHQGVDVIAAKGKRLYAVVDGVVSKVYKNYPGSRAGNGLRVQRSDGTYFTYLHLSKIKKGVGVGTPVKAGDVVGFVGNTGNSATPHLHFEVHPYGGAAVSPYPLLKRIDGCHNTSRNR